VKFTGHVDGFEGPVFDSSVLRGRRKPSMEDFIEFTINADSTLAPGFFEATRLMKVGEKGRFMLPPKLSYGGGQVSFEGDDDGDVRKIPANSALYYDIELVRIIRP